MRQNTSWVIWNIFLAVLPVVFACIFYWTASHSKKRWYLIPPAIVTALLWLAFLPNACYLLTEWRHYFISLDATNLYLRSRGDSDLTLSLMMNTVYYFFYSSIGMLCFTLAIRPVAKLVRRSGIQPWVAAIPFFLMLSIGVYLGLILRFNSWDLLVRPGMVWDSVTALTYRPRLSAFLTAFGGFLWLAYTVIDIWIDGIICRWNKVNDSSQ